MIPVVGLNQVHVAWIEIRGHGFVLYGFMLYSDADVAGTCRKLALLNFPPKAGKR